jgi:hypothetical protein
MTTYIRIFGGFLLIALCAALGILCEVIGQVFYRSSLTEEGALWMHAGEVLQDWAIELMGVCD